MATKQTKTLFYIPGKRKKRRKTAKQAFLFGTQVAVLFHLASFHFSLQLRRSANSDMSFSHSKLTSPP